MQSMPINRADQELKGVQKSLDRKNGQIKSHKKKRTSRASGGEKGERRQRTQEKFNEKERKESEGRRNFETG